MLNISERGLHFPRKRSTRKMACLVVLSLFVPIPSQSWAASDPFVGPWKLKPSQSKLTDQMKVESLGGNQYAFDFGGKPIPVVADGTDQLGNFGITLGVAVGGPHTWAAWPILVIAGTVGDQRHCCLWRAEINSEFERSYS